MPRLLGRKSLTSRHDLYAKNEILVGGLTILIELTESPNSVQGAVVDLRNSRSTGNLPFHRVAQHCRNSTMHQLREQFNSAHRHLGDQRELVVVQDRLGKGFIDLLAVSHQSFSSVFLRSTLSCSSSATSSSRQTSTNSDGGFPLPSPSSGSFALKSVVLLASL